jgi:hypothetical protein
MNEHQRCPYCDAKLNNRTERLTKGLCKTLIKFWHKSLNGTRARHLLKACGFTTSEINNFQKLRYFGLVEKTSTSGVWRMTPLGEQFAMNCCDVPVYVEVYRNEVKTRSTETASITAILQTEPYWLQRQDYVMSASSSDGPLFQ